MPPTEQCVLGAENKTNIENIKEDVSEFKGDMRRYMERMDENIEKLTNHYSQRPSWAICVLITGLVALCVYLANHALTHDRRSNEPPNNPQPVKAPAQSRQEKTPPEAQNQKERGLICQKEVRYAGHIKNCARPVRVRPVPPK